MARHFDCLSRTVVDVFLVLKSVSGDRVQSVN